LVPYETGKLFQLIWNDGHVDMALGVPVAGANVLLSRHPPTPNVGLNVWVQKREHGRIYLVDTAGQATNFCLDVTLPGQQEADGVFPSANGCLVYLNNDQPYRQTQLWQIMAAGDVGFLLLNTGMSLSIQVGPGAGPYVLDSGGNNLLGGAAKIWQLQPNNRNQVWQLRVSGA
jgi:hypothetical protein